MAQKLFLVEDDEDYAEFIKKSLRKNYKIYSFKKVEECLITLKSILPDIILLDYDLKGIKGTEMFEKVKDGLPEHVKVIVLSSIDDGNLVLDFIKRGVRNYVVKDENVIETLNAVIEGDDDLYFEE